MTADQSTKYIIDLLNIKVESEYSIIEIGKELGTVRDIAGFIQYIRDRINSFNHQYLTGFQKFIVLASEFKKIEAEIINKPKIEKMGSVAERLANKVREIDTIVLNAQNDCHEWEKFKYTNGDNAFSEKEIKALSVIGCPLACVRLQRSISGRDMLYERLEAIFVDRITHPQLEAPKQSVDLIGDLAQSVKVK